MSYQTMELTVDAGIARLTFNNPGAGNAFTAEFCREFPLAVNELSNHDDVRVVLLEARGRFFSVGGDVSLFSRNLAAAPSAVRQGTLGLHSGLARLLRLDAPIVASVHSAAHGGAVSILSNCDLVYAAESAVFGAAYSQLGFSCDLGASFGLASRMGLSRARRFLLLGETLGAREALQAGLVDHVIPDDSLLAEATAAARKLAAGPTRAYGAMRHLMSRSLGTPFEAQLEDEAQALARIADTDDAREGITAFSEKRGPEFQGR